MKIHMHRHVDEIADNYRQSDITCEPASQPSDCFCLALTTNNCDEPVGQEEFSTKLKLCVI
jgi:hypothetical protein